jgi:hypothetical protein
LTLFSAVADEGTPALSNVAASAAAMRAMHLDTRAVESLVALSVSANAYASDTANAASNEAFKPSYVRSAPRAHAGALDAPFTGVSLSHRGGGLGSNAAVQIVLSGDCEGGDLTLRLDSERAGGHAMLANAAGGEMRVGTGPLGACQLSVGASVDVRSTGEGAREAPPDLSSDVVMGGDGFIAYVALASSVFSTDYWAQAYQGLSRAPPGTGWLSADGSYGGDTGLPAPGAPETHVVMDAPGISSPLVGEWLQVRLPRPLFVNKWMVSSAGAIVRPDDLALLGSSDGQVWEHLSLLDGSTLGLAPELGGEGRKFPVRASHTGRAYQWFRMVVMRVRAPPGWAAGAPLAAQVDVFKVYGSEQGQLVDALLRVDDRAFVVDRAGHVGVGIEDPSAPLQFGNAVHRPRTLVLHDDDPADPLGGFRGLGVAPGEMLYQVGSPSHAHVFLSAGEEIMRVCGRDAAPSGQSGQSGQSGGEALHGRVGVGTAFPEHMLDVAGDLNVRGPLRRAGLAVLTPDGGADLRAPATGKGLMVDAATGYVLAGAASTAPCASNDHLLFPQTELDVSGVLRVRGAMHSGPASNVLFAPLNVVASPLAVMDRCEMLGRVDLGRGALVVDGGSNVFAATQGTHITTALTCTSAVTALDGARVEGKPLVVTSALCAASFCNLVDDYVGSQSTSNAPSARALYQAALDLSSDMLLVSRDAVHAMEESTGAVDAANVAQDIAREARLTAQRAVLEAEKATAAAAAADAEARAASCAVISVSERARRWIDGAPYFGSNSIHHQGLVGVNTTAPAYALHVAGDVCASRHLTVSDSNLQRDLLPMQDALHRVRLLRGYTYQDLKPCYRGLQPRQAGLVAQQVATVLPEAVCADAISGVLSISYEQMVPLLLEAVRELADKVDVMNANRDLSISDRGFVAQRFGVRRPGESPLGWITG